jgi:hypothetical protein
MRVPISRVAGISYKRRVGAVPGTRRAVAGRLFRMLRADDISGGPSRLTSEQPLGAVKVCGGACGRRGARCEVRDLDCDASGRRPLRVLADIRELSGSGTAALLHWRMFAVSGEGGGMMPRGSRPVPAFPSSAFAGFRFPPEIIVLAVRWYLRFGLSYRDVEELLTERGIEVDHVTVFRWVQRFTPLLADAARPCRHAVGDRWSWTRPT